MLTLAARIRRRREMMGENQQEFAARIGVSQQRLSDWEHGPRLRPLVVALRLGAVIAKAERRKGGRAEMECGLRKGRRAEGEGWNGEGGKMSAGVGSGSEAFSVCAIFGWFRGPSARGAGESCSRGGNRAQTLPDRMRGGTDSTKAACANEARGLRASRRARPAGFCGYLSVMVPFTGMERELMTKDRLS